MIFGTLKPTLAVITDLDGREILTLTPLVVLTILIGIYPKPVLDMSAASVTALLDSFHQALGAAKAAALGAIRRSAMTEGLQLRRRLSRAAGARARRRRHGAADDRRLARRSDHAGLCVGSP